MYSTFFNKLLLLGIHGEGVWVRVFLVGLVVLLAHALPDSRVDLREESVGILPRVVDMGDIELVYEWQELAIDHTSTDDESLLVGGYSGLCLRDRVHHFGVLKGEIFAIREHDIAAIR